MRQPKPDGAPGGLPRFLIGVAPRGESNQSCALVSDLSVTHKSVVILNLRRISIVFSGFTAKNVF